MNRKSNSGDFDNKVQNSEPRLFEKWLAKNNLATQTPVVIQQSFRNLEDPIEYIRDEGIKKLQHKTKVLEQNMRYEKQLISQMSKSNYKKVISRDKVEYQFGNAAIERNMLNPSHSQDYQKRSAKKTDDNQKVLIKRQQLKKQFIHGNIKHQGGEGMQETGLTMDFIRDLDTKDFYRYKNYQFFHVFDKSAQQREKYPSGATDISQNYDMDQLFNKMTFNLIDRDSQYSAKSSQYLFKADQQLDFWRRNADTQQTSVGTQQIEVMKRCQNFNIRQPSFLHLLDFAAGKLDGQILAYYFKLKARHQTQMKLNENDENLQQEYKKKKQELDVLRELKRNDKTHRVNVRTVKNTAQTIDNLEDQSFDSYFEESARDIILKIKQLNKIRDSLMQGKEQQQKTMLVNIGHQIKSLLFRLLTLTLKGENFVNYQEIISMEQQSVAEKKILEIIYHDFQKVQVHQVDGISKSKMLEIYLEQRQKNERIFELLGRNHAKEKKQTKIRKKK